MDGFAIISDPTRRRMIDVLREGESDVGTLIATLRLSQPLVSKHLRVLRDAGTVVSRTVGRRRVYRLAEDPLPEVLAWVAPYHLGWARSLDTLSALVDAEASAAEASAAETRGTARHHRDKPGPAVIGPGPATGTHGITEETS